MKLRMLVIGANGFLGARLMQSDDSRFEMIGADRSHCDVTNPASVRAVFDQVRPHTAVLAAALADIDRCELAPALARAINVNGVENVARECARTGTRLLFTSSGAVFDGTACGYLESDVPNPVSVYGKTKAEAECVIRQIVPHATILRVSLVLGFAARASTNALLDKLQTSFRQGTPVYASDDEFRNAIDADTLCRWMLDLACAPAASGVFHLGASDAMSRYEIVSRAAEAMGFTKDLVISQSTAQPGRAPRGRCHLLVPSRIEKFSPLPVPTCAEAVGEAVSPVTLK